MNNRFARMIRTMVAIQFTMLLAAVTGHCAALPGNWLLVDSDSASSDFYYNKAAVARSPEGIMTVTVKTVYSAAGKADALQVLGTERYEGLAASTFEYDLDCKKLMCRLKKVAHFDAEGRKLAEFNIAGKTEWEKIPLYSRLDLLQVEVCE
jgi:hypothetical protein